MKGKLLFVLWFCVLLVGLLKPSSAGSRHHNSGNKPKDSSETHGTNSGNCATNTNSDSDQGSSNCEPSQDPNMSNLTLVVKNTIDGIPLKEYCTHIAFRGILLGAMTRLMNSHKGFWFTYSEDPNYGAFLESVNCVSGNFQDHTYWELLVNTTDGEIIRADVGIGCYIPEKNEKIILNFTKW